MTTPKGTMTALSRRTVLVGIGTAGILPTGALGRGDRAPSDRESTLDAHTRDTYRALVDAILPRTPSLAEQRGQIHEPGALDVGLDRFVVDQLNGIADLRGSGNPGTDVFEISTTVDRATLDRIDDEVRRRNVATASWILGLVNYLSADGLYGAFESLTLEDVTEQPDTETATATAVVRTAEGTVRWETNTYPIAELLAVALNVLALGYVASGTYTTRPKTTSERFPAGGAFVRLAPMDRLRCIDWLGSGDAFDVLGDQLEPLLPAPQLMHVLVAGVTTLPVLGYYRGLAGADDRPRGQPIRDRGAGKAGNRALSRRQAGYPGFESAHPGFRGYELDGFRDNDWTTEDGAGAGGQAGGSSPWG